MSDPAPSQEPRKRYFFDDGRNVRRVLWAFYAACALALGAEFFMHRHVEHPWEGLFGFYALFGFGAYALLVILAEVLRRLVARRPDYYDD